MEAVIGPVDGGWNSDVITCYAVPQYAPHRLADDIKEIGGGSDKNCTLTVRITQEEKEALCANGGTVIKEIYEYNYFFGAGVIRDSGAISSPNATWYFMSDAQKAAFEAVDGCNGILEFRFMPANVVITTNAGNKPAVMYCPLYGSDALNYKNCYYITENSRYQVVSGNQAFYEVKVDGNWVRQYTLTWDGTTWRD